MIFGKLGIAWSAGCGIICMLLIALWVRSHWWTDHVYALIPGGSAVFIESIDGKSLWYKIDRTAKTSWEVASVKATDNVPKNRRVFERSWLPFGNPLSVAWVIPHFVFVLISSALAVLPWFRYRFSLRTLLIATTIVAVVLGFVVYAARK